MAVIDNLAKIQYYAPEKPEYVLSKGLMEPYNNHNAASRKKMYNVHVDHRTQLINSEIAYIDTGYSNEFSRYNSALVRADMTYRIIGKVSKFKNIPDHDYILLLHNPINNSYTVTERKHYNHITETNGYLYDNKNIDSKEVGDVFTQGDVIRKSISYDESLNKRDGINLETCFMNIAKTTEDGIFVSEAVRRKFDSPELKPVRINLNDNNIPLNLYGEGRGYKICPNIGEHVKDGILMAHRVAKTDEQYYVKDYNRLRQIMASDEKFTVGEGQVIDINIYCNNPALLATKVEYAQLADMYNEQLKYSIDIFNMLDPIINDKTAKRSAELEDLYLHHKRILNGDMFVADKGKVFSFLVLEFVVLEINTLQIGDKFTNRFGGKGVVSGFSGEDIKILGFLPEEQMPLLDNGRRVEVIVNSAGVVGRLNPGQLIELSTNFIGSRILDKIKSGDLPPEQEYELYLRFLKMFSPNQYAFTRDIIDGFTTQERAEFIEEICRYKAIHLQQEPISESYGIDKLAEAYREFDFVEPYTVQTVMVDSTGNIRYLNTRRTLVSGQIYYYRLKQHAKEKFATTSLSATNVKNQNARSRSSKMFRAPYSRTPKRMGTYIVIYRLKPFELLGTTNNDLATA